MEVVCEDGSCFKAQNPLTLESTRLLKDGEQLFGQLAFSFNDRYARAYAAEVDAFASVVLDGALPVASYTLNKVVADVCDAALHSAQRKVLLGLTE